VLTSPIDDGSVAVKIETENNYNVIERTHSVIIDNDATSMKIEMSFSEIKSHLLADLSLAHSSLSHAGSKMYLGK